jgi:hypothetical protein
MFDPDIPGGFPSGYGGASGAETGLVGGISPLTGPLMVLGATQGLGPWQGISDFLDSTFNSSSKLRRHAEAAAPQSWFSQSINTFLNEAGLNSYKTEGKGSTLQGSDAFKRAGKLSKIVRKVREKYPGYTQWQYAEMFKRSNLDHFMPNISVSDAKESRKQELLNPETDPAWGTWNSQERARALGAAALHKEYYSQENFNYNPKELRTGKGSNPETRWRGRRTDMTMDLFFKNLQRAFDNDTFLPATGATQEQPPAQEQPTQERSLAENAFNAFKGIGIGSAITRNVFNPKRLPRPDLGFGQKLFSRQY